MNNFQSVDHLHDAFVNFDIKVLGDHITVADQTFVITERTVDPEGNVTATFVDRDNQQQLQLNWTGIHQMIIPRDVKMQEMKDPDITLSLEEPIIITGINNEEPFIGKIDTGADMCSLHADNIKVHNSTVEFTINNNKYKMMCHDVVTIQNAEGTEERPTVKFNVTIKGKTVPDTLFNINDRSEMDHMVLIGTNLLEKTDFIIDVNEEITDNQLNTIHSDSVISIEEQLDLFMSTHLGSNNNDESKE